MFNLICVPFRSDNNYRSYKPKRKAIVYWRKFCFCKFITALLSIWYLLYYWDYRSLMVLVGFVRFSGLIRHATRFCSSNGSDSRGQNIKHSRSLKISKYLLMVFGGYAKISDMQSFRGNISKSIYTRKTWQYILELSDQDV